MCCWLLIEIYCWIWWWLVFWFGWGFWLVWWWLWWLVLLLFCWFGGWLFVGLLCLCIKVCWSGVLFVSYGLVVYCWWLICCGFCCMLLSWCWLRIVICGCVGWLWCGGLCGLLVMWYWCLCLLLVGLLMFRVLLIILLWWCWCICVWWLWWLLLCGFLRGLSKSWLNV